jgi:hypothetical protein
MNYGGVVPFPCSCRKNRDWLGPVVGIGSRWELASIEARVLKSILVCLPDSGKSFLDKILGVIKSGPGAGGCMDLNRAGNSSAHLSVMKVVQTIMVTMGCRDETVVGDAGKKKKERQKRTDGQSPLVKSHGVTV